MGDFLVVGILGSVIFFTGVAVGGTYESKSKTDVDIMQARNFVADYESRMERIRPQIESCNKLKSLDSVQDCRKAVYDLIGIEYYDVDATITNSIKSKYESKKATSLYPLTSELK